MLSLSASSTTRALIRPAVSMTKPEPRKICPPSAFAWGAPRKVYEEIGTSPPKGAGNVNLDDGRLALSTTVVTKFASVSAKTRATHICTS